MGPATHPSWPIAQANDSTPEPITAVMMCALAVHSVPAESEPTTIRETEDLEHSGSGIRVVEESNPRGTVLLLTGSLEAAIIVETFGSTLWSA